MTTERWRKCLYISLLAALAALTNGCADRLARRSASPRPVDMELLQFLGSADPTSGKQYSAGRSWMVYLSKLKLGKVAGTTKTAEEHASTTAAKSKARRGTSGVRSR